MQTNAHKLNRRHFLQTSLATAAACGLARPAKCGEADAGPIIDTHVYLGRWPYRRLAGDEPAELVRALRSGQVSQAWAGSFDGLFHKDIHGVNLRLVETCRREGDGLLIPIGTINPTLPDWEEDLRRCHAVFHTPGIRLHPNYHGYALDDPRFARLLELAAARHLVVQLIARMTDERHRFLSPRLPEVDLSPLANIVRRVRGARLLVTNGFRAAQDDSLRSLAPLQHVYVDFTRMDDPNALGNLFELIPADHIVFGSGVPLFRFESAVLKLQQPALSADQSRAIRGGTAGRLQNRS